MRLFFAIPLDPPTREGLAAAQQRLAPCFQSGNFSRPENLHVTLVFLGEVTPDQYRIAAEVMDHVRERSFDLQFGGLGSFRGAGRENVYWAGIERVQALSGLQETLSRELKHRGFVLEERPYRPHLTLIRRGVLREDCDRSLLDVPQIRMPVQKFSLMQSLREDGKLVYRELASRILGEDVL